MSTVNVSKIIKSPLSDVSKLLLQISKYSELFGKDIGLKFTSEVMRLDLGAEYQVSVTRFGVTQPMILRVTEYNENLKISFDQTVGFFKLFRLTITASEFAKDESLLEVYLSFDLSLGVFGKLYDDLYLNHFFKNLLDTFCQQVEKHSTNND